MSSTEDGPASPPPRTRTQARSRETRRRIAEAAYRLFAQRGYGVPLAEVAEVANVSVQNVYVTFQNKRNLAREALQWAVHGPGPDRPPHEQPWFAELLASEDAATAVAIWVENTLPVYERVAPLASMFVSEPDLAEAWNRSETLRLYGFRQAMTAIATKGRLRAGIDVERAAEVMFVLLSPLIYQESVGRLKWPPDRWSAWASDAVTRALFEP